VVTAYDLSGSRGIETVNCHLYPPKGLSEMPSVADLMLVENPRADPFGFEQALRQVRFVSVLIRSNDLQVTLPIGPHAG
jgi:hypothetical protein